MTRIISLALPEALVDQVTHIAQRDGRSLETLLTEWIERDVASDPTTMFTPDAAYYIYTPQAGEGAAQVIEELLAEYRAAHKSDHQDQHQQ